MQAGETIPVAGCIVTMAAVCDAVTHERLYKKARSLEEAIAEIKIQSGRQFASRVVEAFLQVVCAFQEEPSSELAVS